MQYRQPMHFQTSYKTGPSFVLCMAPTGQTDAQAGCSQFMHRRRMNLSSLVRTTVYLCSDCTDSAATLSSYSRALLMKIAPRCSQAGLPFQWNEVRGQRTL